MNKRRRQGLSCEHQQAIKAVSLNEQHQHEHEISIDYDSYSSNNSPIFKLPKKLKDMNFFRRDKSKNAESGC